MRGQLGSKGANCGSREGVPNSDAGTGLEMSPRVRVPMISVDGARAPECVYCKTANRHHEGIVR